MSVETYPNLEQNRDSLTGRLHNAAAEIRANIGKITAAGLLLLGATATVEAFDTSLAHADAVTTTYGDLGYPNSTMPCEHMPYNITGKCDNYDWGMKHTESYNDPSEISERGYAYRNCTDYVAWKLAQKGATVPHDLGDGGDWATKANGKKGLTVTSTPKAGSAAVVPATYDSKGKKLTYGHVAFIESVDAVDMSDASHDTITITEYNHDAQGNGSKRKGRASDMGFTKYIDFGITMPGTDPNLGGNTSLPQPKGRLALINSVNAAYAKDEITSGGWHGLTGNNDAFYVSASGTHVALINGSGDAWGTDVAEDKLRVNSTGLVPLYVPKDPNYPGGVKKIETDKDGNMIAITNCSSAWGYRNKPGEQHWVPMTNCGDAIDVDVGSGRFGLVNSCGGAYISDIGYGWTPALNCGDAKDIEIGESSRIMAINSTNTAYLYDAANGRWVNKTPVGDARQIAIGKDKIMVVSSGGAAWGADIGSNLAAPMTQLTANGDAKTISVGANDRMGIINGAGAAYASDEIAPGGKWTPESGNGDAKKFVVG